MEINIDLNPCAEISTAQNFFNDVLATLHLVQVGDTYELDPEFKAYILSTVESMVAICQDVVDNIDQLNQIMVNPTEVKVGFKGYENAALNLNVFNDNLIASIENSIPNELLQIISLNLLKSPIKSLKWSAIFF